MSNYEQNGRSTAEQTSPPTDPRLRGVKAPPQTADSLKLCRDYVWGICSTKECRYRHELEFESMRQILKFCHDFQNRTGCTRPDCTYLHCSRDEENQFLNNGVIPRVLLERYTAMSGSSDRPEPSANHNMHLYHEYVARPPPPPPVAAQPTAGPSARPVAETVVPVPAIKVSVSTLMPHMPGPLPTILAPPPPPPPTVANTPAPVSQSIYTVTPPMQHMVTPMYPMAPAPPIMQPQQMSPSYSLPAIYNPSVPPPPLPVSIQPVVAQKRPAILEPEAGPSKLAKVDDYAEAMCDSCVELSFRAELCAQESEKIQREEEARRAEYDARVEEYEKGRVLLRSKLTPHMFQAADEFIDSSSADMLAGTSSSTYSTPSLSKQLIFQLMEFLVNKVHADTETQSLDALSRRTFTQADFSRLSRLQDYQGLAALLDRIAASSSERRDLSLEPLSRLSAELPSPPLARYATPSYPPPFARDTPDPLYAYQPQAPQPSPRPTTYNYPASSSTMQYGAAAPAQPPAPAAPGSAPAPYQQYLSRMPPNHNPYYRPFQ